MRGDGGDLNGNPATNYQCGDYQQRAVRLVTVWQMFPMNRVAAMTDFGRFDGHAIDYWLTISNMKSGDLVQFVGCLAWELAPTGQRRHQLLSIGDEIAPADNAAEAVLQ